MHDRTVFYDDVTQIVTKGGEEVERDMEDPWAKVRQAIDSVSSIGMIDINHSLLPDVFAARLSGSLS